MMRGVINSSINFRFLVVILAAVLMVFGINQMTKMPVDALPEFSPPYVEIQTEALGLSAKEVEQMITVPMEQDLLAGVAWLDVIRSESVPGLSSVLVYFEPGTDLYQARQMVAERLSQAAVGLPHVSKPPTMIQPLSSASRFMIIGLSSAELSLMQMSVLARWTIAPRLMGVPGVAHVAIWGNRDRQLQVQVDPHRLRAHEVTLEQVVETTGNALWVSSLSYLEASTPGTGGFIDTPNQRLSIWHVLPITSPEELAQVSIDGAETLTLSDVATVVEDHQPLIGDAVVNDTQNLMLVVEKLPGTNSLQVTRDVEEALDLMRPGFTAINFDASLFRPASFIEMAIRSLTQTLVIIAFLFLLVASLLLYHWRAVVVGLTSVVFSLIAALYILYLRGETLNAMVLAGLVVALGILMDEAVMDAQIILRSLSDNKNSDNPRSPVEVIRSSLSSHRGSTIFATLIMLILVIPVFLLNGVTGALLKTAAVSYFLAVLVSLMAGFTITPALSSILFSNRQPSRLSSPLSDWIGRQFSRLTKWSVIHTRFAYGVLIALFLIGAGAIPLVRYDQVLPRMNEPYLLLNLEAAPGTSHQAMNRLVSLVSSDLREIPGVQNVGAHIGRAVFGDQIVGINSAQLWVQVANGKNYDATFNAVQDLASGYTGVNLEVQTYISRTINQPIFQPEPSMTLRVYGEDQAVLRTESEKLQIALSGIPGLLDSQVVYPVEEPTVEIEVDLPVAQQYGVRPGDVRRTAATLLSGIQVGSLFEEQKIFDVIVWSTPQVRDSISDIRNLMIDIPSGGQVPLGDLAEIRLVASPTVIKREAASPYMDINVAMLPGSDVQVANELRNFVQSYSFPLEYHAEVVGNYSTQQAVKQSLLISGLVVLAGIFLLLQAATRNWRLAFFLMITIPAMLTGGVMAGMFVGKSISILGLFGMLAVLGVYIRSVILMAYNASAADKDMEVTTASIIKTSAKQAPQTVLTGLLLGLVFVVLIIFGAKPGHEFLFPIAVSALGTLVTATLTYGIVVPALILKFGAYQEKQLELGHEPLPEFG